MKFSSRWLVLLTSQISLLTSFSLAPLFLSFPAAVHAQWEPDVRLTWNDSTSSTSWNNARSIASGLGGFVHVVWWDNRDTNYEIYYKRSTNAGGSWSADTRLTDNSAMSRLPSISVRGPNVHLVWIDNRDGNDEIYYKRSTDSGVTWGADSRLTNNPSTSFYPSLSSTDSFVHLSWMDRRDGNPETYYKRSTDNGSSWSQDVRLTNDPYETWNPSISASGSIVHVVWHETQGGVYEIRYKRSSDYGTTWVPDTLLTNPSDTAAYPSIAVAGPLVHITWSDNRDGFPNSEVYYKRSTDYGSTWLPDLRLTNDPRSSACPTVAGSGQNVHVVWYDLRDGNYEVYYKRSTNQGINWGPDTRLTNAAGYSWYSSLAVADTMVHVFWDDNRDGYYEVYYKRNPTGNPPSGVDENSPSFVPHQSSFKVSPNPFTSFTRVPGHSSERFVLYDISGRLLGKYKGDRVGEGMAAGVYFLKPEGKEAKPLRIIKLR